MALWLSSYSLRPLDDTPTAADELEIRGLEPELPKTKPELPGTCLPELPGMYVPELWSGIEALDAGGVIAE